FNHAIGLPRKQENGRTYPLFHYEQMLYNELQQHRHLWIKKATGLGVTEFMLRYMAWLCFTSGHLVTNSQMCIVVGPNIDRAVDLIKGMKGLFTSEASSYQNRAQIPSFDTKETVIELNGVHIDEADFFPPGQQQDARDVSERYIAKSNPWIVMVSTPNAPDGLFERIEKEPANTCLYHRLFLDYTYGLDKIYTAREISDAKVSPSFEREYNLKYLGLIGNVFHTKDIEAAIEKGKRFALDTSANSRFHNSYTEKSMGIDTGFGSSNFGVCITEKIDGLINIVHAEEYQRPDFNQMIETVVSLVKKYNMRLTNGCNIYVDGSNPAFIRALKQRVYEDTEYKRQIDIWKSENGANMITVNWLRYNMLVLPVNFAQEHKSMLTFAKELVEYGGGYMAINPSFTKLIVALRTAVEKGEGTLDKEATSHNDLLDAFRMSLQRWVVS
ncbi:MAG: hypothetical protein WA941_11610, partial [Nitrososphaeraceae archaeon]